jgi:hypothetical protein
VLYTIVRIFQNLQEPSSKISRLSENNYLLLRGVDKRLQEPNQGEPIILISVILLSTAAKILLIVLILTSVLSFMTNIMMIVGVTQVSITYCDVCAVALAISRRLPTATISSHVGFMVDKVAKGRVFSKYLGFPCHFSFTIFSTFISHNITDAMYSRY